MDADQKRAQVLGTVRAIAMAAMELPSHERQAFIERTVDMIRRKYEATHGADPDIIEMGRKLLELTREMVKVLEESGGTIGHA